MELTPDERGALESLIGIGLTEIGDDPDPVTASACRKLGLRPTDWHGNRLLDETPEEAEARTERGRAQLERERIHAQQVRAARECPTCQSAWEERAFVPDVPAVVIDGRKLQGHLEVECPEGHRFAVADHQYQMLYGELYAGLTPPN
jgi:hypothetical protein